VRNINARFPGIGRLITDISPAMPYGKKHALKARASQGDIIS
jgi:hypothetical protein